MGCYRVSNHTLVDVSLRTFVCNDVSSTGVSTCCALGSVCLEEGVCHDTGSAPGLSGYYTAACTDPTFKDVACPQRCSGQPRPDIVYNTADSLWACCGFDNNSVSCANPTDETFQISPPKVLLATTLGSAVSGTAQATATSAGPNGTSSDTSAGTVTGSAVPSTTSSPSSSDASASGLSSGAKAGVGIGVALGVILILALLGWFILRRRRRKAPTSHELPDGVDSYPPKKKNPFGKAELDVPKAEMEDSDRATMLAELGSDYPAHELHGMGRSELPSDSSL